MKWDLKSIILIILIQGLFIYISFYFSSNFIIGNFPNPLRKGFRNGFRNISISTSIALFFTLRRIHSKKFKFNFIQIFLFFAYLLLHLLLIFFYIPYFLTDHYPYFSFFLNFGIILNAWIYGAIFVILIFFSSFNKFDIRDLFLFFDKIVLNIPLGMILTFLLIFPIDNYTFMGEPYNFLYPNFGEGTGASNLFSSGLLAAYILIGINNLTLQHEFYPNSKSFRIFYSFENVNKLNMKIFIYDILIALLCLVNGFALIGVVVSDSFFFGDFEIPRNFIFYIVLSAIPSALFFSSNYKNNWNTPFNQ